MKDFLKSFLSFGLATSIEKLLGFIILPIYTAYFNTAQYGIIDMIGTVMAVAIIFGVLQLETSLQRYYYEFAGIKRKLLITNVYLLVAVCSTLIGAIVFLFSSYLSAMLFTTDTYSKLIKLISVQIPIQNLSMLGLVLLRFERENIKFLLVIVTKVVTTLFFVYIFVIHLKFGLEGVFIAQLLAILTSTTLVTVFIRKSLVFRFSKVMSFRLFSYALPQFPARVGSMSLAQANRFFMLSFLSIQAIGIYSVSLKLASAIQLINTAFIMAWAPYMHALFKRAGNKIIFARILPLTCGIAFLFVSLVTIFSAEMVNLMTSEGFYESHKYVGGLALFFALYIIKEVVDIGPKITEKTKFLSFNFFASVVVNISALFVLINFLALPGVVIAMILTNLFLVVVSWYTSNRLYYIPFSIPRFLFAIIPVLTLCFTLMVVNLSITIRLFLAILAILYYGVYSIIHYKRLKPSI